MGHTHSQLVGAELVDVRSVSGHRLVPEAELQQQLVPAGQQHLPPLVPVLQELLRTTQQTNISALTARTRTHRHLH